jgi:hypothetical protein
MRVLAFVLVAGLCSSIIGTDSGPIRGLDADNYPRVGGSTSTVPLGWLLAAHVWMSPPN